MMKKVWLILLAVVLVFGLGVFGCSSGGGSDDDDDDDGKGWSHDLTADGPIELELTGNFEYGDGYQLNFEPPELFDGDKVVKGDVYTLEISFTGDRDLLDEESFLGLGIVDRVTDYWNPLTWPSGGDQEEIETRALITGVNDLTLTFTALKTSPNKAPNYNSLNIQFKSPTDKAASGGSADYNEHPLTLTCTKFIFSKTGAGESEGEGEGEGAENSAFNDAVGMTTGIGAENKATFADGIIDLTDITGSKLFTIVIPSATAVDGTKNITITYVCQLVDGAAKITLKDGTWGDPPNLTGSGVNQYPTLDTTAVSTLVIAEKIYAAGTTKISFQVNGDTNAFKLKIISVTMN
jgi:hypothetical protein